MARVAEVTDRPAIVLGAEGPGLSDAAMRSATRRVRIPISGDVDSLNVGHAAAIPFAASTADEVDVLVCVDSRAISCQRS